MYCKNCLKNYKSEKTFNSHILRCNQLFEKKDEIINLYVNHNYSIRDLIKKYQQQHHTIKLILGSNVKSTSEILKITKQKYKFKHTEQSKDKLRIARLNYMKENPDKTAWRKTNISYPEKLFLQKIVNLNWETKFRIEREYSLFPYFIDFAFVNEKIAVEIDGSQHLLPERKILDEKKDKLLIDSGWSIIRVTEHEIKNNLKNFIKSLENILYERPKFDKLCVGIFKNKREKPKEIREINGRTKKQNESSFKQRKIKNRPDYSILIDEIKNMGYRATGRKYSVTDNTIRKWVKFYEMAHNTNG